MTACCGHGCDGTRHAFTLHTYTLSGDARDVWAVMLCGIGSSVEEAEAHWAVLDATFAGGPASVDARMELLERLSPAGHEFDLAHAAGRDDLGGPGGSHGLRRRAVVADGDLERLRYEGTGDMRTAELVAGALRARFPALHVEHHHEVACECGGHVDPAPA